MKYLTFSSLSKAACHFFPVSVASSRSHFSFCRGYNIIASEGRRKMVDEKKVLDNLMQRLRHVHSEGNQPICPEALEQTH